MALDLDVILDTLRSEGVEHIGTKPMQPPYQWINLSREALERVLARAVEQSISTPESEQQELSDGSGSRSYYLAGQAERQAELKRWQRAAFCKPRTWEAMQGRHKAGDSMESLAVDFAVPIEFVRFVMFPECDLDARYRRASDRTVTMRARAEAAECELVRATSALRSIANSSCCKDCQEAANVAKLALAASTGKDQRSVSRS